MEIERANQNLAHKNLQFKEKIIRFIVEYSEG